LGFCISDLCLVKAFLLIGPRRSLLIQALTPPLAAITSWLALGEPLALRHWMAMAITLAGIAWVISERAEDPGSACPPEDLRRGVALGLVASVAQAVGMVLSKQGLGDYDPVAATFIRVLAAMAGYLVLVTLLGRWGAMLSAARQPRPMTIVFLGSIVGPFLGVALSLVALRHCHAGVAATIFSTSPVLILPFAVALHREKITPRAVGGAVLSVTGIALLML
jgi:drug/metabolite transporter (DMT)-like permease